MCERVLTLLAYEIQWLTYFGYKISSLPMAYLGLHLGAALRAISIWYLMIEKIKCRLIGWKKLYLSNGGKITLIKSTLSNLPTYFISPFSIPTSVVS